MTPEGKVKARVKKWLKESGWKDIWWTMLSDRYRSGLPDFLLIWGGKVIFIEAKGKSKELTKLQAYVSKKICAAGGDYWIALPYHEEGEVCVRNLKGHILRMLS